MERTYTNEARRAQIVRAAIETIAEIGYPKASFARITRHAGLRSPRMISYHFADKDDLIHQILVDVLAEAARFIGERTAAAGTATERLRAYLEANLHFLRDHPAEIAALTEIGPHLRNTDGEPYTSSSAQEVSVQDLATLLRGGQASGEFRDFDVRSMAVLLRGAVEAAAVRLRDDESFDFETYVREVVTTSALAVRRG
ncbi:TetR/AcrR family transcriptional regulator [Amycolatopsis ultiminotia]